uniref:Integrin alpha-2 domain-containing protein n=1 Tax=Denticeps clupeoides TaxID=299321 RepID=A0AAY3ZX65_9TELE
MFLQKGARPPRGEQDQDSHARVNLDPGPGTSLHAPPARPPAPMPRCARDPPLPVALLLCAAAAAAAAFNLDVEETSVYSGPAGGYFGYSVDFYRPSADSRAVVVLVGAPKANTSQPGIVEGGAVYYCPWAPGEPQSCRQIPFDKANNRMVKVNGTREPLEFKSHQWFGASVRAHKGKVVACAPLYHWRTVKIGGEMDPVGTCYIAIQNFSAYAEYSPCRTSNPDPEGQGFCQAGFSVDFTKVVITVGVAEILNGYSLKTILRQVQGEKQTGAAADSYDDSYLGERGITHNAPLLCVIDLGLSFFFSLQMASYFGYTVAVTDVNGDGLDDVLVGAPLYMEREQESNPRELGRVYLYLQTHTLTFTLPTLLTGTHLFGRFGGAIAPLGDLNQDGYNDVAVGSPFGCEERQGCVFIFNGDSDGIRPLASQVLRGSWPSSGSPPGFGFTLRGDGDIDNNHYPDLIVGAFGVGKAVVYRARPVVTINAHLILTPRVLNPDEKSCRLPDTGTMAACLQMAVCIQMSALQTELQLDWLKQRGAVKRVLFINSRQHQLNHLLVLSNRDQHLCYNHTIFLRDEAEFRDKLTPISMTLNYSLHESVTHPGQSLRPILDHYSKTFHQEQAYILLDCGEDNMCIPNLKLSAFMDQEELVIGDDNPLTLIINSANEGEGAYEAELHVLLPPEAEYVGVERRRERLNCEHRAENQTRMVVCDLGNPMVAGTNVRHRHTHTHTHSNPDWTAQNKTVDLRGVSHPAQIVLPKTLGPLVQHIYELHNLGPSSLSRTLLTLGWPARFRDEHLLYALQILTEGPIRCHSNHTLNPLQLETSPSLQDTPELLGFLKNTSSLRRSRRAHQSGTHNCSTVTCFSVECVVSRLDRGQSAVVKIRSRLWTSTFLERQNIPYVLNSSLSFRVQEMPYRVMPHTLPQHSASIGTFVVWAIPDVSFAVPLWVIILAILLGLLVLAMLTLAMWKVHTSSHASNTSHTAVFSCANDVSINFPSMHSPGTNVCP